MSMQGWSPPANQPPGGGPLAGAAQAAHHRMDVSLDGKAPQDQVHYQPAMDPASACQGCISFQAPNSCGAVAGQIDPAGTCDLFESPAQQQGGQPAAAPAPPQPQPGGMLG